MKSLLKTCVLFTLFLVSFLSIAGEKKNLVLLPISVSQSDNEFQQEYGAALQQALSKKYRVFYGADVEKALEKEYLKPECTVESCLQNVAIAFNGELIADAAAKKTKNGYLLKVVIRSVIDDEVVESYSHPCRDCDELSVLSYFQSFNAENHSMNTKRVEPVSESSSQLTKSQLKPMPEWVLNPIIEGGYAVATVSESMDVEAAFVDAVCSLSTQVKVSLSAIAKTREDKPSEPLYTANSEVSDVVLGRGAEDSLLVKALCKHELRSYSGTAGDDAFYSDYQVIVTDGDRVAKWLATAKQINDKHSTHIEQPITSLPWADIVERLTRPPFIFKQERIELPNGQPAIAVLLGYRPDPTHRDSLSFKSPLWLDKPYALSDLIMGTASGNEESSAVLGALYNHAFQGELNWQDSLVEEVFAMQINGDQESIHRQVVNEQLTKNIKLKAMESRSLPSEVTRVLKAVLNDQGSSVEWGIVRIFEPGVIDFAQDQLKQPSEKVSIERLKLSLRDEGYQVSTEQYIDGQGQEKWAALILGPRLLH